MATVYRAVDTRLDRVLALKVMHPTLATDATFVERFIREAKSVARLDHPNVVQVFDQGAEGAYVYLAMEYIAGCTLRDVLRERGALRPRAALDILEPVLAALGAAHRAGFVHRDMKPENVLIGDDGRVKVADFGLVRAVDTVTHTTGSVLGTVSYLAPEQIEHGTADPRVDVYACGVVLYEMLTGGKPHEGDSAAQILYKHLHEDVPPPSAAVPEMAYELDELVATATARNPEIRPHDAVTLLAQARLARAALSAEQLDAVPPQAIGGEHDNAEDRTSVIPRALTSPMRPLRTGAATGPTGSPRTASTAPASCPLPHRRRPGAGARSCGAARSRSSSPSCWSSGSARASGTSTPASSPRCRHCCPRARPRPGTGWRTPAWTSARSGTPTATRWSAGRSSARTPARAPASARTTRCRSRSPTAPTP
jgi:serine/threonine-protein kinase